MDVQIRRAEAADAPSIADVLRSPGLSPRIREEAREVTLARVTTNLARCAEDDSHLVLVAEAPGGVIAGYGAVHWLPYLILTGGEGYVSELFIGDDFRGQGIGGRLLDAITEEARQRGCARLMLLNIRDRESYQRQFYAKRGWVERTDAANFVLQLTPRD
jgi:GNAT superfamily N-acetyltransferase